MSMAISIVIPAYNAATTIRSSIDSALMQLQAGDEVIVVNDGSTDETSLELQGYRGESRVHIHNQDNAGVSAARNHGIRLAGGEYILFLDADDRLLDDALQGFRRYIEQNPDIKLVGAGHVTRDESGHTREHSSPVLGSSREQNFINYVINRRFSITNGAVCITRDVLQKINFPESLPVSEDFCLYAQILANYPCGSIPQATVEVTRHRASLRHQLELFEKANQQIADILFDARVIPDSLMKFKQQFVCNRILSLFRAQYLAGETGRAIKTYKDAIACAPLNIFKLSYLRKYLRIRFGKRSV